MERSRDELLPRLEAADDFEAGLSLDLASFGGGLDDNDMIDEHDAESGCRKVGDFLKAFE